MISTQRGRFISSRRNFRWAILLIFTLSAAWASGTIRGTVTDSRAGDELVGANVMIMGTSLGAATGIDGSFTISNVPTGDYTLQIAYIGYETKTTDPVTVSEGETVRLDVKLDPSVVSVTEVNVKGKAKQDGAFALIREKRNSATISDGISAEEMSQRGDSNVADAMRRIVGVTIQEGAFPVIRGLGDRYTTTQVNDAPVPSPEPDKKAIPLDLIPTALLESVVAQKTYTPDLPGVFAGGSVNIKTKAYPDHKIFSLKLAAGDHSTFHGNRQYFRNRGGQYDFWGFDDGTRAFPSDIPKHQVLSPSSLYRPEGLSTLQWYGDLGQYGRDFNTGFTFKSSAPITPISFGINMGNKYRPLSWLETGYFMNGSFSNDLDSRYFNAALFAQTGSSDSAMTLTPYTYMDNNRTTYKTNLGLNFSTGVNILEKHKVKLQGLFTHTSNDQVTEANGYTPNIENGLFIKQRYIEKSIGTASAEGTSVLPLPGKALVSWKYSAGKSTRFEPDTRTQSYHEDTFYEGTDSARVIRVVDIQAQKAGYREFIDGYDRNRNLDVQFKDELKSQFGDTYCFQFGVRKQANHRRYQKRSLAIINSSSSHWSKDVLYTPESSPLGSAFDSSNYFMMDTVNNTFTHGLILVDETANNAFNAYRADETTQAGYVMMDIPLSLSHFGALRNVRLIGGIRAEDHSLGLSAFNPVTEAPAVTIFGDTVVTSKHELDWLPSLTLTVDLPHTMKLRAAASRTLGRPQFREIAPLAYQEFYNGEVSIGYPNLKTARVRNLDLRWEWYPSGGELLTVGLFQKTFTDPIEIALISTPDLVYSTFQNAHSASTHGLEVDMRHRLKFIPLSIGTGFLSINGSLAESRVVTDSVVTLFNGTQYGNSATQVNRPLQGQSKATFNTSLDLHFKSKYSMSISYNTFSKRIHSVGVGVLGNEYEFPFQSLNVVSGAKIGPVKLMLKIKNLLNSRIRFGLIEKGTGKIKEKLAYHPGITSQLQITYAI